MSIDPHEKVLNWKIRSEHCSGPWTGLSPGGSGLQDRKQTAIQSLNVCRGRYPLSFSVPQCEHTLGASARKLAKWDFTGACVCVCASVSTCACSTLEFRFSGQVRGDAIHLAGARSDCDDATRKRNVADVQVRAQPG